MKPVFADTSYFLALLNVRDEAHLKASEFSQTHDQPLLTTVWVLTEVGDAVSRSDNRQVFQKLLSDLRQDPESIVLPADQQLWEKGVALYSRRADKNWSLTDCISFEVMRDEGLTEALTGDRHFEQAGFIVLLK